MRIAEAVALDRTDITREGFRVLGKTGKHRTVYLTDAAYAAVQDYLLARGPDPAPALFISMARKEMPGGAPLAHNRLTTGESRHAITMLRERVAT